MDSMLHDLRLAVRAYLRQPGFAALAILIVALGAGANAAVYSVVRAVLLEPLPYSQPDRLIAIHPEGFVSNADIEFLRAHARTVSHVAASSPGWTMPLTGVGEPLRLTATSVSANLFETVGAAPLLGRTFTAGEDLPGRHRVAVLGYALWQARFDADPDVVGRIITLGGEPFEVIGVMPRDFELLGREADLWVPLQFDRASPFFKGTVSQAVARLHAGVDVEAARRELRALLPEWRRALQYEQDYGRTLTAVPLRELVVGDVRRPLLVLLAAVGVIVLLTAANLGTLLLGRHVARRREIAVRGALGASTWRLLRQTAMENLVLAVAGAAAGLAGAGIALPALRRMLPPEIPRLAAVDLDWVVLATVTGAAMVSVLLFGLLPAALTIRPSLQPLLRLGTVSETRSSRRLLDALVVGQVVMAIVLGTGAGLMARSMRALQLVDPGFDPSQVLTLKVQSGRSGEGGVEGAVAFHRDLSERIGALPGVVRVGAIHHLPLSGYNWSLPIEVEGRPVPPGTSLPTVGWRMIHGDYFGAMRIPLIAGRTFDERDTLQAPHVALVNESLAQRFFGGPAAALGRRLRSRSARGEQELLVVGVVGDVRHASLARAPEPELYRPVSQSFSVDLALTIRTETEPMALAAAVRAAVWSIDDDATIGDLMPLTTLLRESLSQSRLVAALLFVFASVGLLVLLSGVYGVAAYSMRRRERELGIRLALGAAPRAVGSLILRQGAFYAGLGLAIGVPLALGLSGAMRGLLFGVEPGDPVTMAGLAVVIAGATISATLPSARRARRVDPAAVLKMD